MATETAEEGRKDGYFLSLLLGRGKFVTGVEARAQRDSAESSELSWRFLHGTRALEIKAFKPMKSEVIFVTLPYKLQEIVNRVHRHKGGAGKRCQSKECVLLWG